MSFTVDETLLLECLRRANPEVDEICIKKYDCKQRTLKEGSSYTSNLFDISVEYECDGKLVSELMVAKVPFSKTLAYWKASGMYDKETYMYETLLPKLIHISPLSVVPKHYFTTESDVLLLEDLTEQGYLLVDRMQWNFEQCVLLLEELAKFHAASVKLNFEDPAAVQLASRVTFFTDSFVANTLKCVYPRLLACLQAENVDPVVLKNFASYEQQIREGDIWLVSGRVSNLNVLVHGNLKANNILLKCDGDKAVSVKILDYQTCVWTSPAFELLYFFMGTVGYEVFEKHSHEFLDRYLKSLNESLTNMGCDCTYAKNDYDADVAGSKLYLVYILVFIGLNDIIEVMPGFHFSSYSETFGADEVDKIRLNESFRCSFLKFFRYFEKRGYFS